MLRIWGRANSINVMKVLWLCEELAVPFERIDAGGAFGVTRGEEYLARNPNALVPTIEEPDGFVLWESNSILRYLARSRAAGQPIYPAEPRAAADCDRWMDWQLSAIGNPMRDLFWGYVRTPEEKRDPAALARAREEAERLWRMVEARVQGHAFLCGEALTLADITLAIFAFRWFHLPIERAAMPALRAWYERCAARPGFQKHCAAPMT